MERREQLVSVAFDLFYRYGVHAVGINRVLAESGVAKKTLYNHFPGKEDLVAATVDYRDRQFFAWMEGHVQGAPAGKEALHAMFRALDEWFHGRDNQFYPFHGCYFINVSAEFGDPEHPIHQQCARHKKAILGLIKSHVSQLLSDEEEVIKMSDAIAMLKEGAIVQAHVLGDLQAAAKAWAIAEELLEGR